MPHNSRIYDIMSSELYTVDVTDTIKKADEIMRDEKVEHVPVMENDSLVGVITERKIMEYSLRQIYEFENPDKEGFNKIIDYEQIMEKCNHVIFPEDSIAKAVKLMSKYNLKYLPVVDWQYRMQGIVTITDLLLFFNKKVEDEHLYSM